MANTEPTYHLEKVIRNKEEMADFEGPLNLILQLLSKNRIEIRDIRISEICEQYLEYLQRMEELDMEVTSQFVQMASYLLYIKTKMMLSTGEEDSGKDELELLMSSLEELKARDMMSGLRERLDFIQAGYDRGALFLCRPPEDLKKKGAAYYSYHHKSWELLSALLRVYTRNDGAGERETPLRTPVIPSQIVYNVRDKSREILEKFRRSAGVSLMGLYRECMSRSEVVAAFLSVLELCSLGRVAVEKDGDDLILRFTGESLDRAMEEAEYSASL